MNHPQHKLASHSHSPSPSAKGRSQKLGASSESLLGAGDQALGHLLLLSQVHYQGAEWEVAQLGPHLVPIWDTHATFHCIMPISIGLFYF